MRDAWLARSCSSYASTGARHVRNLGENHSAEPNQPTEICEILTPPSSLKTSAEVFRLEPEGLQSGM